jgi:hypothetical protein
MMGVWKVFCCVLLIFSPVHHVNAYALASSPFFALLLRADPPSAVSMQFADEPLRPAVRCAHGYDHRNHRHDLEQGKSSQNSVISVTDLLLILIEKKKASESSYLLGSSFLIFSW